MGKGIQIPWDKLHFTIFTHAQKFLQRNQTFPQTYLILILCTPSLIARLFSLFFHNIFISFITIFFLFGTWEYKFSFFTTTNSLSTLYLHLYSPLTTTPILTIMKCQLSQDQGNSWFFGLKGLSPMWDSKENYHGFSL